MSLSRCVVALALVAIVGCQSRLNIESKFNVTSGGEYDLIVDAPKYEQKILVAIASNEPVDVVAFLKKDDTGAGTPKNLLGSKKGVTQGDLEITVPAKEQSVVRFTAGVKAAAVSVKVVGR